MNSASLIEENSSIRRDAMDRDAASKPGSSSSNYSSSHLRQHVKRGMSNESYDTSTRSNSSGDDNTRSSSHSVRYLEYRASLSKKRLTPSVSSSSASSTSLLTEDSSSPLHQDPPGHRGDRLMNNASSHTSSHSHSSSISNRSTNKDMVAKLALYKEYHLSKAKITDTDKDYDDVPRASNDFVSEREAVDMWGQLSKKLQKSLAGLNLSNEQVAAHAAKVLADGEGSVASDHRRHGLPIVSDDEESEDNLSIYQRSIDEEEEYHVDLKAIDEGSDDSGGDEYTSKSVYTEAMSALTESVSPQKGQNYMQRYGKHGGDNDDNDNNGHRGVRRNHSTDSGGWGTGTSSSGSVDDIYAPYGSSGLTVDGSLFTTSNDLPRSSPEGEQTHSSSSYSQRRRQTSGADRKKKASNNDFDRSTQRKHAVQTIGMIFCVLIIIMIVILGVTLTNPNDTPGSAEVLGANTTASGATSTTTTSSLRPISTTATTTTSSTMVGSMLSPVTTTPTADVTSTTTVAVTSTALSPPDASTSTSASIDPSLLWRATILSIGITTTADLDDAESPQARALAWLSSLESTASLTNNRILQRYALATLYYATEGRGWTIQTGWMTDTPECAWFYRSPRACEGDSLVRLSLGFNNLGGTLPKELGLLSNLEDVSLSGAGETKITGTLPSTLTRWTNLEFLNLRSQGMTGGLEDEMVNSWVNMSRLDLTLNSFTGTLPPSLGGLSLLRNVYLASNNFTGMIPTSYGSIRASSLGLANNGLTGAFPVGVLVDIRELSLENNQLSSLPEPLAAPKIRRLIANDNRLSGSLPSFQSLQFLELVILRNNQFNGTIPTSWSALEDLENVDISSNQLTGAVPAGLTTMIPSLSVLRLDSNSVTSITCNVVAPKRPEWYSDCGGGELDCECCSHCCVDGEGCQSQP